MLPAETKPATALSSQSLEQVASLEAMSEPFLNRAKRAGAASSLTSRCGRRHDPPRLIRAGKRRFRGAACCRVALLLAATLFATDSGGYSVLTHEELIDLA